jgi:DNA recombination protein RmuC
MARIQNEKLDRTLQEMNSRLGEQNRTLNTQLAQSSSMLQQQFKETASQITKFTQEITSVKETNKQIQGFAEQLQSLEKILKNPKQRGVLGEYYLETVLKNVLPPAAYEMQHKFNDGMIVDAIVKVKDMIICIDAKFSLENYNRLVEATDSRQREEYEKAFKQDLKNRIDETAKYIRPDEGTTDFAFMFIPADGLYYDLLVQKVGAIGVNTIGLVEYAFKQRVILVSPTTFFAYLQTVLQGLRALQIEESAKEIQKHVEKLQNHLRAYEEHMSKLGSHLGTTVNAYNRAAQEFGKVDKDMIKISGGESIEIGVTEVDKPHSSE